MTPEEKRVQLSAHLIPWKKLVDYWGPWQGREHGLKLHAYLLQQLGINSTWSEIKPVVDAVAAGEGGLNKSVIWELAQRSSRVRLRCPDRVRMARQMLKMFFELDPKRKEWLDKRGMHVLVGGSIQYADPVNLDADVLVVTRRQYTEAESDVVIKSINGRLAAVWHKLKLGSEPHISLFSLARLSEKNFQSDPIGWAHQADLASLAFTGMAVNQADAVWVGRFQDSLRPVIGRSPVLVAIVNHELIKCLDIRRERAG